MSKLNVILRLEHERAVLVASVLEAYLFSLFVSLRFYLLLEGDKQRKHEYRDFCPLWL